MVQHFNLYLKRNLMFDLGATTQVKMVNWSQYSDRFFFQPISKYLCPDEFTIKLTDFKLYDCKFIFKIKAKFKHNSISALYFEVKFAYYSIST